VGLVLALLAGTALPLAGIPLLPALLFPLLLLAPIGASLRPSPPLVLSLVAGVAAAGGALRWASTDCRLGLPGEAEVTLLGRFEGSPAEGPAPFRVMEGLPDGCTGTVRVSLREGIPLPPPGAAVRVEGNWRKAPEPHPLRPEFSGTVRGRAVEILPDRTLPPAPVLEFRGRLQGRIQGLYGPQGPLVDALILARKEGVSPELRELFALSGTAHLLAISGFHVGVVAGILFTLLRWGGASRERAAVLAALGSWGYVLSIGAPHAAARAATLVSALAAARLRGRPVHPWGALAAAALLMVILDPLAPAAVGFQLSFAGAAGLVALRTPIRRLLGRGPGERVPAAVMDGLVAGIAATVATAPLVAWYFDRVSLVGIPATLVVGPLVALVIPGILASLVLSSAILPLGQFLAGGVSLLLEIMVRIVEWAAVVPGASPWVPRSTLLALALGGSATLLLLRALPGSALRTPVRGGIVAAGGVVVALAAPLLDRSLERGVLTLTFLDVGQGDAMTIRTPSGRWIVVDAGPRGPGWDAGARVVLPHLRQQGARRVELMVLTHPHLDHVGGAGAILEGIEVGRVADPGLPAAGVFYREILDLALEDRVGWWPLQAGEAWEVDGLELAVLHPAPGADTVAPSHGANSLSVVLELRFGEFRALLTGDAPREVEDLLTTRGMTPVQLLKVGHHGSRTSTGPLLLDAIEPLAAVIPVGRGNSFGHPHLPVLERLERAGVALFRTDHHGDVVVRARRDGGFRVEWERSGSSPAPPYPDFRSGNRPREDRPP
jgi:competence protein ComEC